MGDFLEMDYLTFKSSMQVTLDFLGAMGQLASTAVTQAMVEFAEYLLSLMQENAPKKTGFLIEHSYVSTPRVDGDNTVVEIVWEAPYAKIQDTGGQITPKDFRAAFVDGHYRSPKSGRFITKRRVGGARLFIPMRPGVVPIQDPALRKAAGYKYGVDFVFKQFVVIEGTEYITRVIKSEMYNADRTVGRLAERIWVALAGEKIVASRGMSGGSVSVSGSDYSGHRGEIITNGDNGE